MTADARQELKQLMAQRDALEAEVEAITSRLNSGPSPPGLSGSLVDREGFPRGDIDLYAVRRDRQRLACLTNDHKDIMKKIDQALVALHNAPRVQPGQGLHAPADEAPIPGKALTAALNGTAPRTTAPDKPSSTALQGDAMDTDDAPGALVPFAWVDEVAIGSPAEAAGVQVGDHMSSFGGVQLQPGVTSGAGRGAALLPAVARELSENENRPVPTVLLRQGQQVTLSLTPRKWEGRGLLGCHLTPL